MAISDHIEEFGGKKVYNYEGRFEDPATHAPALRVSYDESDSKVTFVQKFAAFFDPAAQVNSSQPASTVPTGSPSLMGKLFGFLRPSPPPPTTAPVPEAALQVTPLPTEQITALVIGAWDLSFGDGTSATVVDALVKSNYRYPNLRHLFLGDILSEECEISWIVQSDVTPLLNAFPDLEEFGVRGGGSLVFQPFQHGSLKKLVIETGGLDRSVVEAIASSKLPALEHLEIWFGDENYGANTTVGDLAPFFAAGTFPNLKTLALKNADFTNEIVRAVFNAPVLSQLEVLDLSLGTLDNEGAEILLDSPSILSLLKLDLTHHYCSPDISVQLRNLPIEVIIGEPEQYYDEEESRYVAVSE